MTDPTRIRALVFDVFGTVVDWRGGIAREVAAMAREGASRSTAAPSPMPGARAISRRCAGPAASGPGPSSTCSIARTSTRWCRASVCRSTRPSARSQLRLAPARSVARRVAGLARLKRRWSIATLSNGNVSLLVDWRDTAAWRSTGALRGALQQYKPDPEAYRGAARLLGVAAARSSSSPRIRATSTARARPA